MNSFMPADLLLPRGVEMEKWAVIACDQFTSEPEYWERVRAYVGAAPSSLHLIFPEAELKREPEKRIAAINARMEEYRREKLFTRYEKSFVYVERRLSDGSLRRGLVGMLDLEDYDYSPKTETPVRATERTVLERIPPRVKIREHASLELPHVLLLCDDEQDEILAPLRQEAGETLYDFDLMENGGKICGRLVSGAAADAVCARLETYERQARVRYADLSVSPMLYAVGDGNHSLATAKACYEQLKKTLGPAAASHPARWALVELENLHDPAQRFAPIHRIVTHCEVSALLAAAREEIGAEQGVELGWFSGAEQGILRLNSALGTLPVGIVQNFLDRWLAEHPGEIDYIHGEESLRRLAQEPDSVGFLLPEVKKNAFFRSIMADGVLPRKTFSMGQARDKRYYLEAREIV